MSNGEVILLERSDVARRLNCSGTLVQKLAVAGRLQPIARTPRGSRLFLDQDVETLAADRAAKRAMVDDGPEAA